MPARTFAVSAELEFKGVDVRVLDYRWSANEHIYEYEDDTFILRYRPYPAQVSVAAHLHDGSVQPFGQLMFFPAQLEVNTTAAESSQLTRNIMCSLSRDWFQEIWPDQHDWRADSARCFDLRNFRIEQTMQRLGMEAACPGFASNLIAESLGQLLVVEIARHFCHQRRPTRVRTFGGQFSGSELKRIYEYIESVAQRCPTTREISKNCGISSAHLRRSFKHTTGLTLHQHVANARLSKARTLLVETDLPLKEVAFRLGFASSSTFSSTFRRASGEAPSSYRQRLRGIS